MRAAAPAAHPAGCGRKSAAATTATLADSGPERVARGDDRNRYVPPRRDRGQTRGRQRFLGARPPVDPGCRRGVGTGRARARRHLLRHHRAGPAAGSDHPAPPGRRQGRGVAPQAAGHRTGLVLGGQQQSHRARVPTRRRTARRALRPDPRGDPGPLGRAGRHHPHPPHGARTASTPPARPWWSSPTTRWTPRCSARSGWPQAAAARRRGGSWRSSCSAATRTPSGWPPPGSSKPVRGPRPRRPNWRRRWPRPAGPRCAPSPEARR